MKDMQKISRNNSGRGHRFALFLLFACFANDGMMWPGLGMEAFGTSRCFSLAHELRNEGTEELILI